MSLRICLSVSLCVTPLCHHHPSTTKKKKKKTQDDDVYEHSCARINQSPQSVFVAPLLRTDGNLRHNAGGLSFEAPFPLPVSPPPSPSCPPPNTSLPFFPLPLCTHQAEIKASISQSQAPEPGCRRWKPASVTTRRQISPCI